MIDLDYAIKNFEKYVSNYDLLDEKVKLKIKHTYGVMKISKYIADDLKLSSEDVDLAQLIGLLHDIGRFEQLKRFNSFNDRLNNVDHGKMGVDILFENNFIREFVKDDKYDDVIFKAIMNHNKYKIEDGLEDKELLHAKIIRDADKTDNYRVAEQEDTLNVFNFKQENLENDYISEDIYSDYMNNEIILYSKRKTNLDIWVSHLAYMFDFNFNSGLRYINKNDYINKIVDKLKIKNDSTKVQIENIRNHSNEYVKQKIK